MDYVMTAKEVSEIMRVSTATVRNMANQNRFPFRCIKIGTAYRFPKQEVMEYINGKQTEQQNND